MAHDAHGAKSAPDLFGSPERLAPSPTPKKPPTLYPIPPNARRARCSGQHCDAVVYWVEGRRFPISADCADGLHPDATPEVREAWRILHATWLLVGPNDGMGVSHFVNCPDAPRFSGRGRRG